jgi:hypothetical protein
MKNPIMKVTVDVKDAQATEKTRGSDVVAEGAFAFEVKTSNTLANLTLPRTGRSGDS